CQNTRGTCVRGIAGNSRCRRGIPAHAATAGRSRRLSRLRLPQPWQLDQEACQGLGLALSQSPPYDRGNAGATGWQAVFESGLWRQNILPRPKVLWDRWIRRADIEESCRKYPCSNDGKGRLVSRPPSYEVPGHECRINGW